MKKKSQSKVIVMYFIRHNCLPKNIFQLRDKVDVGLLSSTSEGLSIKDLKDIIIYYTKLILITQHFFVRYKKHNKTIDLKKASLVVKDETIFENLKIHEFENFVYE